MIVKVINDNGSSKMVVINEQLDAYDVCMMLTEKNHQTLEPNWTLVERLEDFELGNVSYVHAYIYMQLFHHKTL